MADPEMAGGRILVIDDDNVLRASISRILEEEGYTVDSAPDGATALSIVARDPPDAILLDVMMPGMNGRQFLHELRYRAAQPDIPVVVMTALQGLSDRAIEYGADDFVEKPFDVDELLNKVALALFRSGGYDRIRERRPPPLRVGNDNSIGRATTDAPASNLVVVVADPEDAQQIDELLADADYTAVTVRRANNELPALVKSLSPRAVVIPLRDDGQLAMDALRILRADSSLDGVRALVVAADSLAPSEHAQEIKTLSARVVRRAQILEYLR
jgi:DNA-binding response OmpR family regulator